MGGMHEHRVVVVGSINVDLVVNADRLPAPGETVLGGTFAQHDGGKGANQAVAAARAGARVTLIGAVGDDAFGVAARAALAREGVGVGRVVSRGPATGVALITVDPRGENQIVVAPGANALLLPEDLPADALDGAAVLLTGFEVPMSVAIVAVRRAADRGISAVVNAAPAAPLPPALLEPAPILVLNEHELAAVTGEGALDAALDALMGRTSGPVVVTRGAVGAILARGLTRTAIAAFPTRAVVDTTGAGDAFVGVLAARLAGGSALEEAIVAGAAAGALAVARPGARGGMPSATELTAFLASDGG